MALFFPGKDSLDVHQSDFLRLWRSDRALRWTLPAIAVLVLLLLGLLPKLWPTSESLSGKTVRISGLDWLQSHALQRSAREHEAAGRHTDAAAAWWQAWIYNPGPPEILRGFLRAVGQQTALAPETLGKVYFAVDGLLKLGGTNIADLALGAGTLAKHGQWAWVCQNITEPTAAAHAELWRWRQRALFEYGEYSTFDAQAALFPERIADDERLTLMNSARVLSSGASRSATEVEAARVGLEAAVRVAETASLARKLLLEVAYHRQELLRYQQIYEEAAQAGAVGLIEQVRLWQVLHLSGATGRAEELARQSGILPASVAEAELLLSTLARLRLRDQVSVLMRHSLDRWSGAASLWLAIGNALVLLEDWEELRLHAVQLRQVTAFAGELGHYSWFLEGVAEHRLKRPARAVAAWREFAAQLPRSSGLTSAAAVTIDQLGYPEEALPVFLRLLAGGEQSDSLLLDIQRTAFRARQVDPLIQVTEQLFERNPQDPRVASNRAAVRLLTDENPAALIPFTLRAALEYPQSGPAQLNHALALVRAGRALEAAPWLNRAEAAGLDRDAFPQISFARFCYHAARGQRAEALAVASNLSARDLFPPQAKAFQAQLEPLLAGER